MEAGTTRSRIILMTMIDAKRRLAHLKRRVKDGLLWYFVITFLIDSFLLIHHLKQRAKSIADCTVIG